MILYINDRLRNRRVDFFTEFKLNLKYDSIGSTFTLFYYFNPDNPEHKEFSCVSHFHLCTLYEGDQLMLTGQLLSQKFKDSTKKELVAVSGYSLPGVLEDCEIPLSKELTLQSDGLSLREIIQKYVSPFGISIVIDPIASAALSEIIETTVAKETQSVKSYITELCSERNIIITHNEKGQLVFTKANAKKKPIYHFDRSQGLAPATFMEFTFNGQGIHSEITAIMQADEDAEEQASQSTPLKNPWCPIVYRPHTVSQSSGNSNDTDKVASNALAAELKNIGLDITLDSWDLNGVIVKPGEIVSVTNPNLYLYKKTDWIIAEVDFVGNATSKTCTLRCLPPEVFTGEYPKYFFQGINLH